ncbi:predicted protein [Meyerozyma guilliermondii ATCC 6260]|uniref:Uncharacterized protein n=1 Tax=Meyerozyma guilliermondii (strain ATCC 6260 / CBS 566 / DSM 6381 / JCM 1539 / NBRC 10279 / NRRL Y-324) TaxID=294746 RepID=A5DKN2_PICGU|nr:uncharacterized protein PGUG_03833 [Meyerozyma guilliermondii ATCC 6260]EDK39735.2 predicted protein [Meyerozyma guilliermondii ATCC 6260]
MATSSRRSLLLKEKILRKYEEKKRQRKSLDVGLQEECPDEVIRTNKRWSYFWFCFALFVICKKVVDTVRASREPLKIILRFICVVTCVVTCCITFNYFCPSRKITISGIIDLPLHPQYLTDGEVFQVISMLILLTCPSRKSTEKNEIKNEKDEIKKE